MEQRPRVGLDLWPATTHAPGAGRYARELVRALARLTAPPRLSLLDVGPGARIQASGLGLDRLPAGWTRLEAEVPRGALTALASVGLPAERLLGGCELFHRVLPGQPALGDVPRVQALSELPAQGSAAERGLARALVGPVDVVVFSDAARAAVSRRFGLDLQRVHVLPVGCDHWLRDAAPLDAPPGPPLVLALGRVDHARAPLASLAAFEQLHARGVEARWIWCGRAGDAAGALRDALASSPARGSARWIEAPDERRLPALVASAAVLVHINVEEWTPVTPLEALAFGAAVLSSPLPAFREALGDEARWIQGDPAALGPDQLAAALEPSLHEGLQASARRRRRALAAGHTWSSHAALTAVLWGRILSR